MNCDKQAPSCHSGKPRGHEIRKSSNQAIAVIFCFSCQVSEQLVLQQVARKARGSFRMSESVLCFSQVHVPSLCHPTCTRELGNKTFAAWRRHPSESCCPWIVKLDGKNPRSSRELKVNNWFRPPRLAEKWRRDEDGNIWVSKMYAAFRTFHLHTYCTLLRSKSKQCMQGCMCKAIVSLGYGYK